MMFLVTVFLIAFIVIYMNEIRSESSWNSLRHYLTIYPLFSVFISFFFVLIAIIAVLTEGLILSEGFAFLLGGGDEESPFDKYWKDATFINKTFDVLYSIGFMVFTWYQMFIWVPVIIDKF